VRRLPDAGRPRRLLWRRQAIAARRGRRPHRSLDGAGLLRVGCGDVDHRIGNAFSGWPEFEVVVLGAELRQWRSLDAEQDQDARDEQGDRRAGLGCLRGTWRGSRARRLQRRRQPRRHAPTSVALASAYGRRWASPVPRRSPPHGWHKDRSRSSKARKAARILRSWNLNSDER
jgi:hypothetical protein